MVKPEHIGQVEGRLSHSYEVIDEDVGRPVFQADPLQERESRDAKAHQFEVRGRPVFSVRIKSRYETICFSLELSAVQPSPSGT